MIRSETIQRHVKKQIAPFFHEHNYFPFRIMENQFGKAYSDIAGLTCLISTMVHNHKEKKGDEFIEKHFIALGIGEIYVKIQKEMTYVNNIATSVVFNRILTFNPQSILENFSEEQFTQPFKDYKPFVLYGLEDISGYIEHFKNVYENLYCPVIRKVNSYSYLNQLFNPSVEFEPISAPRIIVKDGAIFKRVVLAKLLEDPRLDDIIEWNIERFKKGIERKDRHSNKITKELEQFNELLKKLNSIIPVKEDTIFDADALLDKRCPQLNI